MKYKISLYIMLLFNSLSCTSSKSVLVIPDIKEIWVYNYFPEKGYTTASAYSEFNFFKDNNIDKSRLSQACVDTLSNIMSDAKIEKLFQTKTGQGVIFAEIITTDNHILRVVICSPNLISINAQMNCWIGDELHKQWLSDFQKRIFLGCP